jgi:hypothetical protein
MKTKRQKESYNNKFKNIKTIKIKSTNLKKSFLPYFIFVLSILFFSLISTEVFAVHVVFQMPSETL